MKIASKRKEYLLLILKLMVILLTFMLIPIEHIFTALEVVNYIVDIVERKRKKGSTDTVN